jgi:hypothetical protein
MKKYVGKNGDLTLYSFRNEEMNRNLRKLGHKVVEDKKKKSSKNACRGKRSMVE